MFPPTQNRPPVLETKAIAIDRRTAEYGRLILDFVKNTYAEPQEKKTFRIFVEKFIHNYLQKRLSKDQMEYMQKMFKPGEFAVFSQIMGEVIEHFQEDENCKSERDQKNHYLEVSNPHSDISFWKEEKIKDETVQIRNKEYFTFAPTRIPSAGAGQEKIALAEISKFYEAMILAYSRLQELARVNGWNISMKLKTDLLDLVDDLDSAVFYVSDEKAGDEVRKVVTEEMEKLQLMIERFGRSETGFDIKSSDGKVLTHDSLVAKAVSKVISDDYRTYLETKDDYVRQRSMVNMTPTDFGKSIKERIEKAGNLTPEQILKVI